MVGRLDSPTVSAFFFFFASSPLLLLFAFYKLHNGWHKTTTKRTFEKV